jgi:NAD(P)-dependent dehydrogenase (short-subunit alcohol dehydrogenase family)
VACAKDVARTLIITGASAGVDRAIAHRFAREDDRGGLIAPDRVALSSAVRLQGASVKGTESEAAGVW